MLLDPALRVLQRLPLVRLVVVDEIAQGLRDRDALAGPVDALVVGEGPLALLQEPLRLLAVACAGRLVDRPAAVGRCG